MLRTRLKSTQPTIPETTLPSVIPNSQSHSPSSPPKDPGQDSMTDAPSSDVKLAKSLTLLDGVAIIVGSLIGSGIFITPTACLIYSGSVGASLVVWFISGLFSLMGALSFAELGTTITKNGGEYVYILEAFGNFLSFLYIWINVLIVRPVVIAIVILSFGYYIYQPITNPPLDVARLGGGDDLVVETYEDERRDYYVTRLIGLLCLGILLLINCSSVKLAMRIQAFLTLSKLLALGIIIVIGLYQIYKGRVENFKHPFRNTRNIQHLSLAFYSGLFSYGGWNSLNSVTGEMKNPHRDLPLSIVIGLPLVTIIYVLANVAYLTVLTPEEMKASTAVAFDFAANINFYLAMAMPIFVALSAFGSANALLFTSGRVFLMGARNGHLPTFFAMIHVERLTPIPSILIQGLISLAYIATRNIFVLINFMSFMSYFFTTLCVVGLLYMRWKYPDWKRPIKLWIVLHLIFLLTSIFILITSLITDYKDIGTGFIILILGIPVYYIFIKKSMIPRNAKNYLNKITCNLQCLLYLVVPEDEDASSKIQIDSVENLSQMEKNIHVIESQKIGDALVIGTLETKFSKTKL